MRLPVGASKSCERDIRSIIDCLGVGAVESLTPIYGIIEPESLEGREEII